MTVMRHMNCLSKSATHFRHLIALRAMGMTATTVAAQRIRGIVSIRRGQEPTRRDSRVMNAGPLLPLPLIANYSTSLDEPVYHRVADETLESIVDLLHPLDDGDDEVEIDLSQGVLSIDLGPSRNHMTWVINKQSPNRQLWWSSPISGPQRYEWAPGEPHGDPVGGRDYRVVRGWRRTTCLSDDLLQQLHGEMLQATGVDVLSNPEATQ